MSKMKKTLENSSSKVNKITNWQFRKPTLIPEVEITKLPDFEKPYFNPELVPSSVASSPVELYERGQKTFTNVDSKTRNASVNLNELQTEVNIFKSSEFSALKAKSVNPHSSLKLHCYPPKDPIVHHVSSGESDVELTWVMTRLNEVSPKKTKSNIQTSSNTPQRYTTSDRNVDRCSSTHGNISVSDTDDTDGDIVLHTPRKHRKKSIIIEQGSDDSDSETRQVTIPKKRNIRRIDTSSSEEEVQKAETPRRKRLLQRKELENDLVEKEEISHLKQNVIIPSRTREKNTQISKYRTLFEKAKANAALYEPEYDCEENLLESEIESFEETSSELEDFIAHDESVEEVAQLPDEFSLSKCQDFNLAFQQFIHYLVYHALKSESVNCLPHDQKSLMKHSVVQVEKRLDMYGNSLAISQGWSEVFKEDLKRYPVYVSQHTPSVYTRCTGCLRMRTVSFRVYLLGPEYDRKTLEVTEDGCEFGDPELDLCYSSFEPESIRFESDVPEFILGRNCHQRSHIFHQIHHFKFQTFRRIIQNIQGLDIDPHSMPSLEVIKCLEKRNLTTMFLNDFETLIENAERYCL